MDRNDSFFQMVLTGEKWDIQRTYYKLLKTLDRKEFTINPAIVNAFYNPGKNSICMSLSYFIKLIYLVNILSFELSLPRFYSHHFSAALILGIDSSVISSIVQLCGNFSSLQLYKLWSYGVGDWSRNNARL